MRIIELKFSKVSPPGKRLALVFSSLAHNDLYRSTGKTEGLPYLVLDIPLVREVEKVGTVTENNKRRRLCRSLGNVIEFKALALVGRGLHLRGGVGEHIVEHTGGNSAAVLLIG